MSGGNVVHKTFLIAKYTFVEIFKSRVILNCFFLGLALILSVYVASEFTYGTPLKVALEFGFGMTSLSAIAISIFLGTNLMSKEIENRTVYSILSRDVPRFSFYLGKFLGLAGIIALNILILFSLTLGFYFFLGGEMNQLLLFAIYFCYLEALILLAFVMGFSLITNSVLSVIFTVGVLFMGHAIPKASAFILGKGGILEFLYKASTFLVPNLDLLNIKQHLIYKEFLSTEYLLRSTTYGHCYLLGIVMLSIFLFHKKSLD
ncbi:MAG: ABC transporter permease [Bacteriovoracaceae bacterium]